MKHSHILLSIIFISGIFNLALASGGKEIKTIKSNIVSELEMASASGINTIMVITDENTEDVDEAVQTAENAAGLREDVMVAVVDRSLEENLEIVKKYNLSRFPLPFLLIVSPTGDVTGGAKSGTITAEKLSKFIPSACFNQALTAKKDGKSSIILISSGDRKKVKTWEKVIKDVEKTLEPAPEIIRVNPEDENEKAFLSKLRYYGGDEPVLMVANSSGQITGKYTVVPEAGNIIKDATKVVKSGCGGCSSAKSCSGKEKAGCGDK
jgi:hypothetical protein